MNCVRLCINYNVMIECLLGGSIFLVNMKSGSFFKLIKKCAHISGLVGQKWSLVNFGEGNICLLVFDDVAWPLIRSWNYSFKISQKNWTQNRNQSTKWLKVLSGKIGKLSQFHVGNAISLELNYLGSQRTNQRVCVWRSYCPHRVFWLS